jgi:hypothetical protein
LDVDSTSDVFVEAVFERERWDSAIERFEEFDWRIADEEGVSCCRIITVVDPSIKEIIPDINLFIYAIFFWGVFVVLFIDLESL